MAIQLVVSGNRILAHGTDCFISMGGTVICPETERVYQNATVVNCDTIPADLDTVGYEYHAGEFVPCAPYGKGDGNIAVVCGNDCKAIKDSGIPVSDILGAKLLWQNASPGSTFNGQTITLADDKSTFLLIETAEQAYVVATSATLAYASVENYSMIVVTTRRVTVSGKNVTISSALSYGFDNDGGILGDYNYDYMKPLKIYGM